MVVLPAEKAKSFAHRSHLALDIAGFSWKRRQTSEVEDEPAASLRIQSYESRSKRIAVNFDSVKEKLFNVSMP